MPITEWLPAYERKWLTGDILAGLTVWALLVPEAMAYAGIAGVPVEYGLYAAPLALLGYAIFGGSRQLFVGPSSTVAILSAAAVAPLAGSDPDKYLALTIVLALIVGVLFIIAGLARLGFVAKFLAKPVLDGFIIGLAIVIAVGQLDKIFGVEASGSNTIVEFIDIFKQFDQWIWLAILVGAVSFLGIIFLEKFLPKIPAALIVMVLAIIISAAVGLENHGVHIVGEIPSGMPSWQLTGIGFQDIIDLLPSAFGLLIVAYAESLAVAKSYAVKYKYKVDANQEMIALGVANIGAGIFQGYAVDGSLSKSAASDDAGAKTPMVLIICSVLTFLTILFLTGLFKNLPEATLGAIVIAAVLGLIRFKGLKRLWRVHKTDFILAVAALLGVLLLGVLEGVIIGVALSLIAFIDRASRPHSAVLGSDPTGARYVDIEEHPKYEPVEPGLIVYRFDAPLVFSNVEQFTDEIMALVEDADPPAKAVIIDCEMIYEMDTTATDKFSELHETLSDSDIDLTIARVHAPLRDFMDLDGATELIGEDNIFLTVRDAVEELEGRHGGSS